MLNIHHACFAVLHLGQLVYTTTSMAMLEVHSKVHTMCFVSFGAGDNGWDQGNLPGGLE